ncbi:MAG: two-component system response regulator [Spirochaetae bacterium HGW-Spirochaetae-6]|nr:MAG: two-component system response regulator [Spirochaetae bacterium HGW-Spirochaetae-6]
MKVIEEHINKKRPEGLKADNTSYNILIIDDSMFIVKQLAQILSSESYNVIDTASDGEEGVRKYKELFPKVDLVTLDITMPKKDGLQVLKEIIDFDKDARIVIISAIGKQDYVKEALLLGAKNYIVKPLNREKVLERIRKVLM